MGTAQSKRTMSTMDEGVAGSVCISQPHAASHPSDAHARSYESAPVDFEARRHGSVVAARGGSVSDGARSSVSDVPESVNQLLQAVLGDEPGLNISTIRHDSTAAELQRPTDPKGLNRLPTVFRWEHGGDEVFVAGTFSHWKRIPLVKSRDNFYTICELAEGEHEYKFIVDGAWRCDDKVQTKVSGEHTVNNVIHVQKGDFEVFEALQNDVQQPNTGAAQKDVSRRSITEESHVTLGARFSTPPGTYTQEIPSRRALELEPPPPALPPHLLQVLLNKDTAANYDPNLLPEPNHVMLNHLYALSIRDGVMVLSATHRYRKKYVTTLLYKPIQ